MEKKLEKLLRAAVSEGTSVAAIKKPMTFFE